MAESMRAITIHEFGDAGNLTLEEVPVPEPADGEILMRVHAVGINPIDYKFRSQQVALPMWQNLDFPVIVGWDVSGTVARTAGEFNEGDEVFGLVKYPHIAGGCAEFAAAPVTDLVRKPSNIDHAEAAVVPLAALTAWQAFEAAGLKAGQSALIHAGAGGVGHLAIQIARSMGVEVITTASAGNEAFVRGLGADQFIDYTASDLSQSVSGVDFVFHTIDNALIGKSIACLKKGGFVATITGPAPEDEAAAAGVGAARIGVRSDSKQLAEISELIEQGQVKPVVDRLYPLAETADAHRHVEGGHARGKVVVDVTG